MNRQSPATQFPATLLPRALGSRLTLMALSAFFGGTAIAQTTAPDAPVLPDLPVTAQVAQIGAPAPMPPGPPIAGQGPRVAGPGGQGPRMAGPGGPGAHGVHRGGHGRPGGPGMHHGGMGAGGPMMMLLGRGQDRALELVKATPEQRADIRRIAGAARDDLRKAREDGRPRREAWIAAWTADRVDAAALEADRARMAAQRDAAGKRMVQALVDIGAVLQPEQRRLLADQWSRRAGHRRAEFIDLDEHAQALVD